MRLLLIRHALPARQENNDGPADPSLTGVGRQQARRLADWLADEPIDHVASSPKRRAVETAEPLATDRGLQVETVPGFSEIDKDSHSYIPYEQMRAENHDLYHLLKEGRWEEAGYTPPLEFREQVAASFAEWAGAFGKQTLAVVAHNGTINALVSHLLGIDEVFFFGLEYTGLCRLRTNSLGGVHVMSLNESAHLHTVRNALEPLPLL